MRPPGAAGWLPVLLVAWLGVAAVAVIGLALDRWDVVGYPDSLWLYVGFGCAVVAPAVGRVSRSPVDADAWALQSLVVTAALYVAEAVFGPKCPIGADCSSIGARGSLGLWLSLLVIAGLAIAAWGLARWMYGAASKRRPASGRVRARIAMTAMIALLLFPGTLVAAALVGTDLLVRDTPGVALDAVREVEEDCFGIDDTPHLIARAAPRGYNTGWRTFAVHQDGEDRPGTLRTATTDADAADADPTKPKTEADEKPKPKAQAKPRRDKLPDDWATLDYVHPYEATVSFNREGEPVHVTCRKVAGGEEAVADDLVTDEPDSNPMSPKTTGAQFLPRFFTQGVAGPSEEAKKKQAAEAAKKKREAAAKAKEDAAADTSK
jgi:hypothetical protein